MKKWIGMLSVAAVLGLGMVTTDIVPADAATIASSTAVSRTVHVRHGRHAARKVYGHHRRVCRSVVRVRHTPRGVVRTVSRVCR